MLRDGFKRLTAHFPWIGGETCVKNGVIGVNYKGKPPKLVIKDLTHSHDLPSLHALENVDFPAKYFDEKLLCSRMTIPGTQGEKLDGTEPVFMAQMTFIKGGLLLSFIGEHAGMDAVGQCTMMDLLSQICNQNTLTDRQMRFGDISNSEVPIYDSSHHIDARTEDRKIDFNEDINAPASWEYFNFPVDTLKELKNETMKDIHSGYVSTDDCMCALICKAIDRARLRRLKPTRIHKFARALNTRKYMNLDEHQTGVCLNMSVNNLSIGEVVEKPVAELASQIRQKILDPQQIQRSTKELATLVSRAEDKTKIMMSGPIDPAVDIQISSWTNLNCYDLDFNLGLGKPVAVRRPTFIPCTGLIYFLPKRGDGQINVAMSLRNDDLAQLKSDKELLQYCQPLY